jgi:hypothetical protein
MFAFMRQTVCPQRRQTTTTQTHIDVSDLEADTPRRNVYKTHSNVSCPADSSSLRSNVYSSSDLRSNDDAPNDTHCKVLHQGRQRVYPRMRWFVAIRHVCHLLQIRRQWSITDALHQQLSATYGNVTRVRGVLQCTPPGRQRSDADMHDCCSNAYTLRP